MWIRVLLVAGAVALVSVAGIAQGTGTFAAPNDTPAIAYFSTAASDPVAQLNRRLADGSAVLTFDPETGYLRSALGALKISQDSQSLVFSQTSFQASIINMDNPRALYFNDAVAVGWVRGGTMIEVAAQDPRQGIIFYTLDQKQGEKPVFVRDNACLVCHQTAEYTLGVPGLLMASTLPRPDEDAYAGGFPTDHRSPFSERWSGWYVTGNAGARHLGNIPVSPGELKHAPITPPGGSVASLEKIINLKGYLTPYSDVVALMVLSHQVRMTNLLTRVGWEARVSNGGADGQARVRDAVADLVDYMLFVDEEPLRAVKGSSGFAASFAAQGPRDAQGRSLHQLDLTRRLLRYPCSYMIYSEAFDALPPAAKGEVFARLRRVLSGAETARKYQRLSAADRRAITEILTATKPDFAATSAPRTP